MELTIQRIGKLYLQSSTKGKRYVSKHLMTWDGKSDPQVISMPHLQALIGTLTTKVLDGVVCNKKCGMCTTHYSWYGSYENVKKHNCVCNYEGTSKAMEAAALVEMLARAPEKLNMCICTIMSDNDSNGRAKAQHVTNGGKLPVTIEEPKFLGDPSHRKRDFAWATYKLASVPQKTSKVSKCLAGHLKYCYGACVKQNRNLPKEKLSLKVYNVLAHTSSNHNNCDSTWCNDLKAKEKNEVNIAAPEHRIKKTDQDTSLQLKTIFDQYTSVEQMGYCKHLFDTQTNESLNESIANVAPKNVCYSNSISLFSRVSIVIGVHNLGYSNFFHSVFEELTMSWSNISEYLKRKHDKKEKRRSYQQKFDVKVRRSKQQKKSREEVYKE